MNDKIYKLPRLYVTTPLNDKGVIAFDESQAHYLNNVMRRKEGDEIRVFNGREGEWVGQLSLISKKKAELTLTSQIHEQPATAPTRHLVFAPIKKANMEWMIEKAVELGVTDLHPIQTQNTQNSKIKIERVEQQIIEACEQCERLTIPTLHPLTQLNKLNIANVTMLACLERAGGQALRGINLNQNLAVIIGPEGGFTAEEKQNLIAQATNISLGNNILRAETAAIKALSILTL